MVQTQRGIGFVLWCEGGREGRKISFCLQRGNICRSFQGLRWLCLAWRGGACYRVLWSRQQVTLQQVGAATPSLRRSRDKSHMSFTPVTHSCREVGTCSAGSSFGFSFSLCTNVFLFPSLPPPPLSSTRAKRRVRKGAEPFNPAARGNAYDSSDARENRPNSPTLSLKSAGKPYPLTSAPNTKRSRPSTEQGVALFQLHVSTHHSARENYDGLCKRRFSCDVFFLILRLIQKKAD